MTWAWFNEGPDNKAAACPAYCANNNYTKVRIP